MMNFKIENSLKHDFGASIENPETLIAENKNMKEGKSPIETAGVETGTSMNQSSVVNRNEDGTFSCLKCNKTFSSKSATVRHYRNHTGNHPYVCSLCQEIFASKSSLSTHELRVHNLHRDVALSCAECGKLFMRRSALDVHLKIHSAEKPFQCDHCGKCFTQKISRDIHIAKHTGKCDFQCSICLKVFASQAKLNCHSYVHQAPRFTCEHCGLCFVRHDSLCAHQQTHVGIRPFQCCVCSLSFISQAKLISHKQMHKNVSCKCSLCVTLFKQSSGIQKRQHTNKILNDSSKDKVVGQADEGSLNYLRKQKSQRITEDSLQRCFISSESKCEMHEKKTDLHSCHLCPKHYAQKSKLSAHIKTHLQEPTHECTICGKRFYRKDVHHRHLLLHRRERTFVCAHCGKSFVTKFNLSAHLKIHTTSSFTVQAPDFQCKDCGKKFKHKNTFMLHSRSHLGEYNHSCVTCGKKFMKKSHFEGHMRSHCSDRPFQCATCGRRFKERKHCQEHGRKSHTNTLNLASLFASISSDNAHVDPINDIIYSSEQSLPQEGMIGSLNVPEISEELQSALVCPVPDSSVSPPPDSAYLSPTVNLNEPSLVISTPISSLAFSNLGPTLQEIQSPNVDQFFMTSNNSENNKTNLYQVDVQNNDLSFTILSGEETSSVLSQGLQ